MGENKTRDKKSLDKKLPTDNSEGKLLEARKEAIERAHKSEELSTESNATELNLTESNLIESNTSTLATSTPLQARGKLWGMDVFSWQNPNLIDLANTIDAFPFQIILIAPMNTAVHLLENDDRISAKLKVILQYDSPRFQLSDDLIWNLDAYLCTETVEQAFESIQTFKQSKFALIFTTDAKNEIELPKFEAYIHLQQN